MDTIIAVVVSSIFSLVIAYLTATLQTRAGLQQEKAKRELDITQQQKHKYFLPFKYLAGEFGGRLKHITGRLSEDGERHDNMVKRFKQCDISQKSHQWFYSDVIGPDGGYYFTSTLYLNSLLFYWIKQIQDNYPYIPLKITDSNLCELKEHNRIAEERGFSAMSSKCEIDNFIRNIRRFIGGENGISYGLHDSFGDFMFDYSKGTRINYDDFCRALMDDSSRVKFDPMIRFWQNIIDEDGQPNAARMKKLTDLSNLLDILNKTEIRVA